jgi:leader peptidase (prepilin peptidase) / N-methyltransferase
MIRIFGTGLAALLGLAFGSFLNVCLSRWPEGESIVTPRSHCRKCGRTLIWWENIPVVSWLALRGRCRTCNASISWRYLLIELSIGALWAYVAWQQLSKIAVGEAISSSPLFVFQSLTTIAGGMTLTWLLVALTALDAEHFWLPNWLTWPGLLVGILLNLVNTGWRAAHSNDPETLGLHGSVWILGLCAIGAVAAAALILLIRWTYWLIRRREGIGLGDAKLMGMLGAWLGLSGALLSFAIGVGLGAMFAIVMLAVPGARRGSETWLAARLPLGTFLCIGGIISALWGQAIIAAYLHWAGL